MIEKFEKEFRIASYECDEKCTLRIRSLFNLFQDMADTHADMLGVGYDYCREHQLGWVGSAYHVQIDKLPRWNDQIIIRTWPSKATAVTAIREFEMINGATNEVIVRASSQWVLIDVVRLRPIGVTPHIRHFEPFPQRSVDTAFPKLPPLIQVDITALEKVRADDMDMNFHVNNAVYPSWVLDALPVGWQSENLSEIQVQYRQPIKDKVDVCIQTQIESETVCVHSVKNANDSTEYARVRFQQKLK